MMRFCLRGALPSLILLALLGAPQHARGYVRSLAPDSGACLFWDQRSIPWTMNARGLPSLGFERSRAAFARSLATWEAVSCTDVRFEERPATTETRIGHSLEDTPDNLVIFRLEDCSTAAPADAACHAAGTCANEFDCWSHGDTVIAVTTTTFFRNSGEIVDADIEMNAANFDFTDGDGPPCQGRPSGDCVSTDIQNTATHEVGHLLGLDHSPFPDATMYASAPRGETSKRRLSGDDIEGVCAIYPAGEPPTRCDGRGGGGGCGCQGQGGGVQGVAVAWVAWSLWRLRRGRP